MKVNKQKSLNVFYINSSQFWISTNPITLPMDSFELGQGGTVYLYDRFVDVTTGDHYIITQLGPFDEQSQSYSGCEFTLVLSMSNLISQLPFFGIAVPSSMTRRFLNNPLLNTWYQTSTNLLTHVNVVVSNLSLVNLNSEIDVQIGTDGQSGNTILQNTVQLVSTVETNCSFSFDTLPGEYYRIFGNSDCSTVFSICEIS